MMSFWALCHGIQEYAYAPEKAAKVWGTFTKSLKVFHLAFESAIGLGNLYEALTIYAFKRVAIAVADDNVLEMEHNHLRRSKCSLSDDAFADATPTLQFEALP